MPIRLDVEKYDITIENTLGKYIFNISQKSETELMIESYLQVFSDQITSNNLKDILSISNHMQQVKSADIKLVTLNK